MRALIGIIACDNLRLLQEAIDHHILSLSDHSTLFVAVDRAAPETMAWLASRGIAHIGFLGGVSGGRNTILKVGEDGGFDFIFCMDDDAFPIRRGWEIPWMHAAQKFGMVGHHSPHETIMQCRFDPTPAPGLVAGCVICVNLATLRAVGYHHPEFYYLTPAEAWGFEDSEYFWRSQKITGQEVPGLSYGILHGVSEHKRWHSRLETMNLHREKWERLQRLPARYVPFSIYAPT